MQCFRVYDEAACAAFVKGARSAETVVDRFERVDVAEHVARGERWPRIAYVDQQPVVLEQTCSLSARASPARAGTPSNDPRT